jgi:putative hydrolase of the HAD superfamily
MAIAAIIFDFGGVIVSGGAMGGGPPLWVETEARFGLAEGSLWKAVYLENEAWLGLRVGEGSHEIWHDSIRGRLSTLCDADTAERVVAALKERTGVQLNEGMVPLITRLRRRYRIGLLSNAAPGLEDELVNQYQVHGLFHDIINSATVRLAKPDPRIFALAASRIRVPVDQCFFTDDLLHNVEAARAAGMTAYQFDNCEGLTAALENAGVQTR